MKPGVKSTEFWVTMVVVVLGVITTVVGQFYEGVEMPDWARLAVTVAGAVTAALAGLGYQVARTGAKIADSSHQRSKADLARTKMEQQVNEKKAGRARVGLLSACVVIGLLALPLLGCSSIRPVAFDQAVVDKIDTALDLETKEHELTTAALEECGSMQQELTEADIRFKALKRFYQTWRRVEEAKKIKDE